MTTLQLHALSVVSLSCEMASNLSFPFILALLQIYYLLEVDLLEVSSHRQGLSHRQGSGFVIHKMSDQEIFIFVA